jgi:predicted ABC-type ATPase
MPARIYVLAGVNGAGKSSIGGAAIESQGDVFYNPDLHTRAILAAHPGMPLETANAQAWELGKRGLEAALAAGSQFKFETTLGARTITGLLLKGARAGAEVHVWYAGLDSPELHIQRVKSRVAAGGHDIPEEKIRQRCVSSLQNLVELLPHLASLAVFDNSAEGDPKAGRAPQPLRVLRMVGGAITAMLPLHDVPAWAKPVVMAALKTAR